MEQLKIIDTLETYQVALVEGALERVQLHVAHIHRVIDRTYGDVGCSMFFVPEHAPLSRVVSRRAESWV